NERMEQGKNFADQVANDLGRGMDDLILNMKSVQKIIDDKISEYKKNAIHTLDVDLLEDDDNYYLKIAAPGVTKDSIDIEMTEKSVHISCEFDSLIEEKNLEEYNVLLQSLKSGKCGKTIKFTTEVDVDNVTAKFENGLIYMDIPKVEVKKYKVNVE
ncbi:Hsp20/alpha crystallin family protein, partial [Methanobrevibacter sp. OttesenSCG-928-I08]|nr:Hsp20/alpha crystallin family protein [Methanobrevibacter sp. OttesenSCG-928-I08]